MRICRIVDKFPSGEQIKGDLAPNYYYLSRLTAEKGFDVHVVCARDSGEKKYEELDGIRIHRVAALTRYRDILFGDFAKKIFEKVKEINPDIVHGHMNFHFGCIIRKNKLGAKVLTHYHSILDGYKYSDFLPFSYNFKKALYDRIISRYYFHEAKFVLRWSDYIIAVSKACKRHIEKYIPNVRIKVVYNGVDPNVFRPVDSNIKEKLNAEHLVLYVGRPAPWKGVQYLLKATKELKKEFDFKVLLLGVVRGDYPDVYLKWLMDLSREYSLDNVIFSKQVPYFEMPKYYSAADCLVLPSYPEALGKVICEALACGTLIVATNGGGIPELIRGTKSEKFLIKPKDAKDLESKMRKVFEKKIKGDIKIFNWKSSVEKLVRIYEGVEEGK